MSPTARALLTLELLQARPGITADALAERLDVTERAARRYVAILREAGIPVESVRGPYGGYRLGRGLRLPPLQFSAEEALALVMSVLESRDSAADPADPVGAALGRIMRALPQAVAEQAETVRRTATPTPDRYAARPDPATTARLVRACADRRRVRIEYASAAGSSFEREVEPWAVVVRAGRWYLYCQTFPHGERRTYRVDRVRGLSVLDDTFTPPAGLDAVRELDEHLGTGWTHECLVRIEAPADDVRRWVQRAAGRVEPLEEQRCRLVGSTENPDEYAANLARLPVPFTVEGCEHLQGFVREIAARMTAAV
ncbi:WYL domain-containing transcriptional regulator [Nocardioides mangrovicus]|uniref:WYL domain-containing transcriptional regulator n=1 Tax=Nocardioides mangrovicus TaxID=2478913 RepID=A0A3L8P6J4_9ACTN|nr:WYL domain-containing protein [Nocardioides mangrovicus]RLV50885.1 WYL domain-containing transcriptional regulator [Nocardioides mangrovicus]